MAEPIISDLAHRTRISLSIKNRRELHSQTTEAYVIVNKDLVLWNRNLGRISIWK